MSKPIMCLDFDGVGHHYITKGKWDPTIIRDGATPGYAQALESYLTHYDCQIFSSRSHQLGGIAAMQAWHVEEVGYDLARQIGYPIVKPPALVGLDDRVITFTGVWPTLEELKAFRPWNQREVL